ncbi:LuxR C-terminal-related transcriptional regulator [Leifsonia sp. NPDC058194]|uniref:LuxR C-terminal-related transcriptional regulator n=1 Tax=Leifsonia sp. NPDC058194 TaxID=3346374 RepID=UPI0036DD075F
MTTREQLLNQALDIIESGSSISIVGTRGSGRSTFVRRLIDHYAARGWRVLEVKGVASFSEYPLLALSLAGVESAREARVSAMPGVVEDLVQLLPPPYSLLVVDDWDDLDEVSWGAIAYLRSTTPIPLVVTRLANRIARDTPTGLKTSTLDRLFEIRLPAMRYDEIENVLQRSLGQPPDPATLSRIYAKSGGISGIAVALAEAARREGKLELKDGMWTASHDLWSPSLNALMESLLIGLEPEQRALLEVLAMGGINELEAVTGVATAGEVERLEQLGLIELYGSADRVIIGVRPPVLAEYFRHTPSPARSSRLHDRFGSLLNDDDFGYDDALGGERNLVPQFVRLINERVRTGVIARHDTWERQGTLPAFIAYAEVMMVSTASVEELDEVFAAGEAVTGEEEAEVRRHILFAEHLAYTRGESQKGIDLLQGLAEQYPSFGPILVARAAEISADLLVVPDPLTLPDPALPGLRPSVKVALHRARAYLHMLRGDIAQAFWHVHAYEYHSDPLADAQAATIAGMCLIMNGDTAAVHVLAAKGMEEARRALDPISMRAYGNLSAFASMLDGRYDHVQQILDAVLPLGEPFQWPPSAQLSLMNMASVAASRQGRRRVALQRIADADTLSMPDGALPGSARGWARTQSAAAEGRLDDAIAIAIQTGDELWDRCARLAAAMAYVAAVELDPNPTILERVRERVEQVEAPVLQLQVHYLKALVADDRHGLLSTAEELEKNGRFGLALNAYERAASAADHAGATADARAARSRRKRLLNALPADEYDAIRWGPRYIDLTSREEEIALLASDGLTNQQIANELILSVRTVESHLLRAMKKIGVDRRTLLREYFENEVSD